MMKKKFLVGIIFISIISANAATQIYRSVDSKGVVIYSDQPTGKAETVRLPAANIATQPSKPAETEKTASDAKSEKPVKHEEYTTFKINSPKDQETFQNATEISVSLSVVPSLQQGDTIQLFLDGAAVSEPVTSTVITIPKERNNKEILVRGSHVIHAVILNEKEDEIKKTSNVTVFVHYPSVLLPPTNPYPRAP